MLPRTGYLIKSLPGLDCRAIAPPSGVAGVVGKKATRGRWFAIWHWPLNADMRYKARMKTITRAVELEDLSDLIDAPPSAYLAYVADGEPEAVRVACRRAAERWLVTLPPGTSIPDGTRVVLLIDDGEFYFELRGVRVRGTLRDAGDGTREVVPEKIITWDYGSMRKRAS
jgi:hypothetical protein